MPTLLIALLSGLGFILAYHTYGRWLARKIFAIDPSATVPSVALNDDRDFVPTNKAIVFGHHFTSIAGTGPIVGPALAITWGWLPAPFQRLHRGCARHCAAVAFGLDVHIDHVSALDE